MKQAIKNIYKRSLRPGNLLYGDFLCLALLLSLPTLLSPLSVQAERSFFVSEDAAPDSISIYFSNPGEWANVYIHVWEEGGPSYTSWPGMQMNEPEDGSVWWYVEVPENFNMFIFNDGIVNNRYDEHRRRDTTGWYDGVTWYDSDPFETEGDIDPFTLQLPDDGVLLLIEGDADDEIVFTWERPESTDDALLRFTWKLDIRDGDFSDPVVTFSTDNGGTADQMTLTLEVLVNILEDLDLEIGDIFEGEWTVQARIGDEKRYAEESFAIDLELGEVEGIPGTITIYFSNPDNWEEVFVHVWEHDGPVYTTWPGMAMTEPEEGSVWWYAEVPENFNMFILNDGIVVERYDDHRRRDTTGWYDGVMWFDQEPAESFTKYENIAELLASVQNEDQGRLTNEVIVTFVAPSNRNQHYLSDSTGAVLVEDPEAILSGLKRGDGVTNFTFEVSELQGIVHLLPLAAFNASSENNDLPYWETTLQDLEYVGEPRLMKVDMVEFQRTGAFERSTNYNILDPTVDSPVIFRTHLSDSDVIGKPIPREPRIVTGIVAEFLGTPQLYATYYDLIEPIVTFQVTFMVNMSRHESFDSESHDVYISGEMIDWIKPGTNDRYRFQPSNDNSDVYTLTMNIKDGFYEYKFFIVEDEPTWDMAEWDDGPNRELDVADDMVVQTAFGTLLTSGESLVAIPQKYGLDQNYPNPFNPSTRISYQLPVSIHVAIDVYDLTGRRVATLVNERKEAGHHSVYFDAGRLASGVYLFHMQAGSHSFTRKMMLVK